MKKRSLIFTFSIVFSLLFGFAFPLFAQEGTGKPSNKAVNQKIRKLQIPFIANEGQADKKVAFYANTFGGTVFVTKEGEIVYALPKSANDNNRSLETGARIQKCRGELHSPDVIHDARQINDLHPPTPKSQPQTPNTFLQGIALKETLIGAKVKEIKGEDKSVSKVNYFRGNDQKKWKSNISTYDVVDLGEVYNGIELKLKAYGNNVEKLFYVKPGANPDQIKINLSGIQPPESPSISSMKETGVCPPLAGVGGGLGASGLWINEQGQLVAETELGPVTFTKPVAYQEIDGKRVNVDVEYNIQNREEPTISPLKRGVRGVLNSKVPNSKQINPEFQIPESQSLIYSFKVASYDKTKELVIDPLLASTFLGGYSRDHGYSMAIDSNENVYIAGMSESSDFPTTTGTYQVSYKGYNSDAFVSKLNSDLTKLIASTYLGGSDYYDECIYSIAIDSVGNIYVTGQTSSSDFPITDGVYDITYNDNGYDYDAFVSKLNGDLTNLLASTYLGGYGRDQGGSIVIDSEENIYVAGYTWASDFPSSSGAYQISYKGTGNNAFITKLSNDLKDVLASTYLGGETNSSSYFSGYFNYVDVALDSTGNLYITGYTNSSEFPVTTGAYDTSYNGNYDTFVSKLNKELTNLLASTYFVGGNPNSIVIDSSGNIYIAGTTSSADFPTTTWAYDLFLDGSTDAFISKFDSELKNLIASTYLGGSGSDRVYSMELDNNENIYVCGYTTSSDFPTSADAYDTSYDLYDIFVSKLNNGLTSLLSSTYLGGSNHDYAYSLSLSSENVFIGGYTTSSDFPTTIGVYNSSLHGEGSCFVSVFNTNLSDSRPTVKTDFATSITGSSATLNGTVNANGLTTTIWFEYGAISDAYEYSSETVTEDSSDDTLVSIVISGLLAETTYYCRIVATNNDGTTYGDEMSFTTLSDTTKPSGSISINSGNSYTNSANVTLTLSASDDVGITGYYISTNSSTPSSSSSGWTSISSTTNYSASISYTLDDGDGSKTIYVWYEDDAGNISDTYSDSIILDTTPPEINITSPTSNDTYSTNISVVSIWGNASDATSGISTVKWENNKGGSGAASGTTSWSISNIGLLVDAENIITVTTTDNAGNSASDSITVTYSELTAVPTTTSTTTPTPIQTPTPIIIPTNTITPTPKASPTTLKSKIFGYVMDEIDHPVKKAKVRCKGKNTNVKENATTNKQGYFEFNNLSADSYKITAKKKGFDKSKYNVNLEEGEEKEIEIVLEEK